MFVAFARSVVICGVLLSLASVARAQISHDAATATATAAPPKAKVVVIPTKSAGGPNLSKDAKSLVEVPLARSVTIVSFATYKSAVLAAGHNQKDIADINTIRSVFAAAGITHAVVVEGSTSTEIENGKSVNVNTAEISLIDAGTGAVIYTTKRTLTGSKLTRSVSTPVVAVIAEKLAVPPPQPPPQPEPPVPVVPVPPPPQVPAPQVEPTDRDHDGVVDEKDACPDTAGVATDAWETNGCPPRKPPETTTMPPAPIAINQAPVRKGDVNMNPTMTLRLGVLAVGRDAHISSNDGSASYKGPLVAANLQAAYFPWAKREAKHLERGLGIYGEGYLTGASSHFKPLGVESTSTVGAFEVGGAFRFPLSENENGPVITLQLGYAYTAWPLRGVIFPGTHYSSPELGFVVDAPLAPHVALFVGGKFMPWMSMGSHGRLGKQDGGYAVRGELGVRFVIAPFELALSGRYTQYNADFIGVTSLGLASELGNVNYIDRYYGGVASLGYSF